MGNQIFVFVNTCYIFLTYDTLRNSLMKFQNLKLTVEGML